MVCSIKDCTRKHYAKTFCKMHWLRFHRHGDPLKVVHPATRPSEACKLEGCGRKYHSLGYCKMHYIRVWKTGDTGSVGSINPHNYRHGLSKKHPLYHTWEAMRQRCNDAKSANYRHYGGRGISVCERWDNFANFVKDVGEKPTPLHSLDRIDNNGNYEPSNVRWATQSEQNRNRRGTKI